MSHQVKTDWFASLQSKPLRGSIHAPSHEPSTTPLGREITVLKSHPAFDWRYVRTATEVFMLTFGFWDYAVIMRCPAKGKQPNKRRCCCQCCLYFNLFTICFHLFNHLFIQLIRLHHIIVISSQTRLRSLISPTVPPIVH